MPLASPLEVLVCLAHSAAHWVERVKVVRDRDLTAAEDKSIMGFTKWPVVVTSAAPSSWI